MSEIPILTLASATYISTKDHLERAGANVQTTSNTNSPLSALSQKIGIR